jgi:bacterioferritin-associated ferredoxin
MLKAMFNTHQAMYVCLCNGVTERDIHDAIQEGASSVEEVAYCTGAGTRCGSCVHAVAVLVEAKVERSEEEPRRGRLHMLTSAA